MKHFLAFACLVCALLVSNTVYSDDPVNNFKVERDGKVCLLATFAARFNVTYNITDTTAIASFAIPANATVNQNASDCSNITAKLVINFFNGYNVTAEFGANNSSFQVEKLILGYTLDTLHFPKAVNQNETRLSTVELDATLAPKGDSYKCDSIISAVYSDFTCTTRMLQLQPFGVENGTYSKATICPEDPTPSPAPTPTPKPTQTPTPPPSPGTWNVTDKEGKLCLLAQFGMEFTIPYSTSMAVENATFPLPVTAVVDTVKSTCGLNNSVLVLNFNKDSDKSNNLTMKFEMNATNFYTTQVTLDYFISHADFPNATDTGAQKNVSTSDQLFKASKDKSYSCHAEQVYNLGKGFMETSDVQLQPFNVDEDFSPSESCKADLPVTTPAPPTPVPTPGIPTRGNYTVKNDDGDVCMLVQMAVEFSIVYQKKDKSNSTVRVILNPAGANPNSSDCSNNTISKFVLEFLNGWVMTMVFNKADNNKYNMSQFILNYTLSNNIFPHTAHQDEEVSRSVNKTEFSVTVGNSYQCAASIDYVIDSSLNVTLSKVHIQPFVKNGNFGAAEDCAADENISNIVPIAVGCALAGLVIIVLIAYLIGRRRSQAKGYQSV